MMDEDYLESVALGYESTDVNYISSLKKISYDHFNDQAVMAHGLLHARMLSAIRFGETEMVNGCLQKGLNVNNGWNSEDGEWSYLHDAASRGNWGWFWFPKYVERHYDICMSV